MNFLVRPEQRRLRAGNLLLSMGWCPCGGARLLSGIRGAGLKKSARDCYSLPAGRGIKLARFCSKYTSQTPPPPPSTASAKYRAAQGLGILFAGTCIYAFGDKAVKYISDEEIVSAKQESPKVSTVDDTGLKSNELRKEVERLGARIQLEEEIENASKEKINNERSSDGVKEPQPESQVKKEDDSSMGELSASPRHLLVAQKPGNVDYKALREEIEEILSEDGYDDGSIGPLLVRLAWHSAGTYDANTKQGGSEGACMRFENGNEASWGANAGLEKARARLEPIKQRFPEVTYSDLWSLAGTVALEEMGGPEFKWRPGRKDLTAEANNLPDGLLPDADGRGKKNSAEHLRDIFYRMGFNDQEIVCLSGAHSLGRCHKDRSGYTGPWTRAPTTLSNEFFRLLLEETWSKKITHEGNPWNGPTQYENSQSGSDLMMLETDYSLVEDPAMKPFVELYATNEDVFMQDFAKVWIKLQELGVRRFCGTRRYYFFGPRE